MGKGYAEGSAVEERLAALERGDDLTAALDAGRAAVYASTDDGARAAFHRLGRRGRPRRALRLRAGLGDPGRAAAASRAPLPLVEQPLDVAALGRRELELRDDPARLGGVVVLDRGLEPLAERLGLAQLPAQPAQQARRCAARLTGLSAQTASRLVDDEPEPLVEADGSGRVGGVDLEADPRARRGARTRRAPAGRAPRRGRGRARAATARSFSQPLSSGARSRRARRRARRATRRSGRTRGRRSSSSPTRREPAGRTRSSQARYASSSSPCTARRRRLERADRDALGEPRLLDRAAERPPHEQDLAVEPEARRRRTSDASLPRRTRRPRSGPVPALPRAAAEALEELVGRGLVDAARTSSPPGLTTRVAGHLAVVDGDEVVLPDDELGRSHSARSWAARSPIPTPRGSASRADRPPPRDRPPLPSECAPARFWRPGGTLRAGPHRLVA